MIRTQDTVLQNPNRTKPSAPGAPDSAPARRPFGGAAGLSTLAGAGLALVRANMRYWTTVSPIVRAQLARWEQAARAIPDPGLRALALGKLRDERFNAQVAATLATLAPRSRRSDVVEAIVALQVLYDYVDVLSEQPADGWVGSNSNGRALLAALTDAVTLDPADGRTLHVGNDRDIDTDDLRDYYRDRPQSDDGGYLQALAETVRTALAGLPNAAVIAPVAQAAAARCAEAQILNHDASRSGIAQLRRAATAQASGTGLGWQEYLAGATASVLAIGALIAIAADPATTRVDAKELDALYLSIGALTMLDSLVDHEEDIAAGRLGYVQYYDDPGLLASRLALLARDAVQRARVLPDGAHHIVTLVGIVAYYASAPAANTEFARPLTAPVRRELRPLLTPTLALMRAWRAAKRVREWRARDSGKTGHSPKGAPA
jgi:tetraprenyl-beta-curcumene synthase